MCSSDLALGVRSKTATFSDALDPLGGYVIDLHITQHLHSFKLECSGSIDSHYWPDTPLVAFETFLALKDPDFFK